MTTFLTVAKTNRLTNLEAARLRPSRPDAWHNMEPAIQLDPVPWLELPSSLGFLKPIHAHLPTLNALFGFATRRHQPLPFEKLVEANQLRWIAD
jgi:hypothetical protein